MWVGTGVLRVSEPGTSIWLGGLYLSPGRPAGAPTAGASAYGCPLMSTVPGAQADLPAPVRSSGCWEHWKCGMDSPSTPEEVSGTYAGAFEAHGPVCPSGTCGERAGLLAPWRRHGIHPIAARNATDRGSEAGVPAAPPPRRDHGAVTQLLVPRVLNLVLPGGSRHTSTLPRKTLDRDLEARKASAVRRLP